MFKILKFLAPILLIILFMTSMVAFGAPVYVNVGPTTEFDGDIKILSEIVAEGTTADGWETTIFFTDPTADRTITIPDFDVTVGTAIYLTVTDNENTNETNAILFTSGGALGGGVLGIESDGDFYYNPSDGSVHAVYLYGDGSNITNVGAASASALTFTGKEENTGNIVKGQAVYISGAAGAAFPLIGLADCDDSTKIRIIGLAAEAINQNTSGLVRRSGLLSGVDTLGANAVNPNDEAWAAGDLLYVDDTAGGLTNVKPTSGRVIKAAYTLYGSSNTDDLLVVTHENPVYIACAAGEDIDLRMGDAIAANKVLFQDYANNVVGYVDSDGKADFTSLTLDTALLIAEGGTNSAAALTNDRVMVSSGGAIIHSATITVTELGLLNGIVSVSTGVGDNDKFVTQGYVDDIVGGATTALDNLAAVQINTTLLSDAADTDSLGTATAEWLNLYIGDAGKIYCGLAQDISIHRSAAGIMTLTAANGVVTSAALTVTGALGIGANNLTLTGYVGRDADNFLGFDVDNTLKIEINNVLHSIVSITDGAANNDKLCTQGYADDAAAGGGANVALSNLAGVAINLSLVSDAADTDDLGSATSEWLNLYLGTYGTVYFGTGQTENIAETALNELTITATTVAISGTLAMGANNITTTGYIGRDADNYLSWDTDNTLKIEINNVLHSIVSITTGLADNDKLATQGYVDDQVAGANVNLSNLGAVAINTSLLSDAADIDSLGSVDKEWLNLYIGEAGKIYLRLDQSVNLQATGAGILTITAANGIVTSNALTVGGTLALAANSITMTGSIGVTGSRVTKLWATDLEVTNAIAGSITGTARGLVSVANADITIQPNGTGDTIIYAPADVVTSVNAVHTMTIAEAGTVKVSAAGAAYTITLPTAAGHTGLRYHFVKTDYNYTLITLDGHGAETFNYENSTDAPVATYPRLNTPLAEVTIVSDGTNWQVIGEEIGQIPECWVYLGASQLDITTSLALFVDLDTEEYDIGNNYDISTWTSGTTTGTTANHVIDSGGAFTAAMVNHRIKNTTDTTYTYITAYTSATDITVRDDIFVSGEGYEIKNAKFVTPIGGKYQIIFHALWVWDTVVADKGYEIYAYDGTANIVNAASHASHVGWLKNQGSIATPITAGTEITMKIFNNTGVNTVDVYGAAGGKQYTFMNIRLLSKD